MSVAERGTLLCVESDISLKLSMRPEMDDAVLSDEEWRSENGFSAPADTGDSNSEDADAARSDGEGQKFLSNFETEEGSVLILAQELGGGSFSKVVAGEWCATPVAVKQINVQNRREFEQEARVLEQLRHPNIVVMLGVVSDMCWIIYERLEAKLDVRKVYKDFLDVLKVARDVAKAMTYAHRRGFIHRDLKPSNVLFDGRNNYKVCDWGLSRQLARGGRMTGDTGTYAYMAPEVIRSDKYDHKCDVFSFAVLLWTLASGSTMPYPHFTPVQAAAGVVRRHMRPPLPSSIDSDFTALMVKCWDREPEERPGFQEISTKLSAIEAETRLRIREKLPKKSRSWWGS
eukprot:Plantae.Rhodophyta-Purpureofilum_apyrenoidigerum.ctg14373.p1 GENE.Plantae.Rhodophyta-Purpureofilum_apyrenoidigerum.ctg14373~~Plantae.Rhodophyta-Purpureofilum_apyrenoidigerum.ctg14373.p1  ORF type:complete len:344 (+),score=50.37 Plantae.Rhodophyta-Purpureofilum_apyrenoidigerum.ctg14373:101-1132(+)